MNKLALTTQHTKCTIPLMTKELENESQIKENEKLKKRMLVGSFRVAVNEVAEQMQEYVLFGIGPIGSLTILDYYFQYLPKDSFSPDDKFTVSQNLETEDSRLVSVFTPFENEDGTRGITKKTLFATSDESISIGERTLNTNEMTKLVKVMKSPPLNASFIKELVEPTRDERIKIETEQEFYKKALGEIDKALGGKSSIINDDSIWK